MVDQPFEVAPPPDNISVPQAEQVAALAAKAARSRKAFRAWGLVSIILLLAFPAAWLLIALVYGTSTDVGQGFYLIGLWFIIFVFFCASLLVTIIMGVAAATARKNAAAASAWQANQQS